MKIEPQPSEKADAALKAIKGTIDFERKKGIGLSEKEDMVRRTILESFPRLGRAPSLDEIARASGTQASEVLHILHKLNDSDILYLKPGAHQIEGAYPFSNSPTGHRVTIEGRGSCFAMCAIDALGVPYMFNADTAIDSACAQCGRRLHIEIKNGAIVVLNERDAMVWIGTARRCGHAATSICRSLLFICSHGHVKKRREGIALTMSEALYVGREIFSGLLKRHQSG